MPLFRSSKVEINAFRSYLYVPILKAMSNIFLLACAICGVLCISLPIPIIVNIFNKFYEKAKIEEEIEVKRKKTSWEDAKRGKPWNVEHYEIFRKSLFEIYSGRRSLKLHRWNEFMFVITLTDWVPNVNVIKRSDQKRRLLLIKRWEL